MNVIKFFGFFLFLTSILQAEIIELAPDLTVNTDIFVQKLASCGEGVPGDECLMQCYDINNQNADLSYTCNLQAKATFKEQINLSGGGTLFTGNTLNATDFRAVVVYPYQTVSICFNYGKEVVSSPAQPSSLWVFQSSEITADDGTGANTCVGGTVGEPPVMGSPTEGSPTGAPTGGTPTEAPPEATPTEGTPTTGLFF